jgi:uncharacterized membrane protein
MDKEKLINLVWVLVLVPIVFSIFGAIRQAGLQATANWPLQLLKYFAFLALLTTAPYIIGKLIKYRP